MYCEFFKLRSWVKRSAHRRRRLVSDYVRTLPPPLRFNGFYDFTAAVSICQ